MADWRLNRTAPLTADQIRKDLEQRRVTQAIREDTADQGWVRRNLSGTAHGVGAAAGAMAARAVGANETADDLLRTDRAMKQVLAERDAETPVPDLLERGLRSAGESVATMSAAGPLGTPGIIGTFAVQAANRAYVDAIDAALDQKEALKQALVEGTIEGGITSVFQTFAPGLEAGFKGGQSAIAIGLRDGIRRGVKEFARRTGQEIPEEVLIEISTAAARDAVGMGPKLTPEVAFALGAETLATTVLTMGLAESVNATGDAMNAAVAPETEAAGRSPQTPQDASQETDASEPPTGEKADSGPDPAVVDSIREILSDGESQSPDEIAARLAERGFEPSAFDAEFNAVLDDSDVTLEDGRLRRMAVEPQDTRADIPEDTPAEREATPEQDDDSEELRQLEWEASQADPEAFESLARQAENLSPEDYRAGLNEIAQPGETQQDPEQAETENPSRVTDSESTDPASPQEADAIGDMPAEQFEAIGATAAESEPEVSATPTAITPENAVTKLRDSLASVSDEKLGELADRLGVDPTQERLAVEEQVFQAERKARTAGTHENLPKLVEAATTDESDNKSWVGYLQVTPDDSDRVRDDTDMEVGDFTHIIEAKHVRHALRRHGNPENLPPDEAPVTPDDFLKLPEIVSSADKVTKVEDTDNLIRYQKRYNGHVFVVEEARDGRGVLAFKTMWKIVDPNKDTGPGETPETPAVAPGGPRADPDSVDEPGGETGSDQTPELAEPAPEPELSERDQEIVDRRAAGETFTAIGKALGVSRQMASAAHKRATGSDQAIREMAEPNRGTEDPTRQTLSQTPDDGSREVVRADAIVQSWERVFAVPLRVGGFSQRAAGLFKVLPEVIRVKEKHVGNLAVASHEIAHALDKRLKITESPLPAAVKQEFGALDYEPKGRVFEGFAEFVRHHLTEGDAESLAPAAYKWFTTEFAKQHPDDFAKLQEAARDAQRFAHQGVLQRIRSAIGGPAQDRSFADRMMQAMATRGRQLQESLVDSAWVAQEIQNEATKRGHKGIGVRDAMMAYQGAGQAHAAKAFSEGVHSIRTGEQLGSTSLYSLADHVRNEQEYSEAVAYSWARHTMFMAEKRPGYNTGMRLEDAETWIEHVKQSADNKAERYESFARQIAQWRQDMLSMLVDAQAMASEDRDRIVDFYGDNSFPLHRVQDEKRLPGIGGPKLVNLPKPIRGRSQQGSGRPIIDPLDAMMMDAQRMYDRAGKARIVEALRSTVDPVHGGVEGLGGFMDKIDPNKRSVQIHIDEALDTLVNEGVMDADEVQIIRTAQSIRNGESVSTSRLAQFAEHHGLTSEDTEAIAKSAEGYPLLTAMITTWRTDFTPHAAKATVRIYDADGNPVMYEMDRSLYEMATGMNQMHFGPFLKLLQTIGKPFRAGAVSLSTAFGLS